MNAGSGHLVTTDARTRHSDDDSTKEWVMRRKPPVQSGAVLSLCLALAGCTGSPTDGGKEPPAHVLNIRDINALTLPLDAYSPTRAQRRSIQVAKKALMTRCLEGLGLKADLPNPRNTPFQPNTRRYGIAEEARAGTFGYSAPEISKRPRQPGLSPEVERAVFGKGSPTVRGKKIPDGGCEGKADQMLGAGIPDPKPDLTAVGRLGVATLERSARDSRVRAVFAKWSACMKRSGFNYSTPVDANSDRAFIDSRTHDVTKRETATALADVRCKKETNLINVWAGVETAYQKIAIAQNKPVLTSVRKVLDTRIRNAAKASDQP
ncbi:hypothetical protein [Actinomadura sp. 6N118]|uniref:hypothetical protein n=1 Tax=Actinomadura sp. 6N118 TaxID=3375151 RepID=UPI00379A1EB6